MGNDAETVRYGHERTARSRGTVSASSAPQRDGRWSIVDGFGVRSLPLGVEREPANGSGRSVTTADGSQLPHPTPPAVGRR
ncbi:hypothetical protein BRD12_08150, partial [Halobacteriales archaeon SW_12_67_38]